MEDQSNRPTISPTEDIQANPKPVVSEPQATPVVQKKKSGSKILLIVLILLFLGVIGIAGGAFALGFFSNKNIPVISDVVEKVENSIVSEEKFAETVQDEISTMLFSGLKTLSESKTTEDVIELDVSDDFFASYEAATNITSYKDKSVITVNASIPATEDTEAMEFSVQIDSNGAYVKDGEDVSLSALLDGSYSTEGVDLNFAGEFRSFTNEMFLKITTLPDIGYNELKDKWIRTDLSETTELAEQYSAEDETVKEAVTEEDLNRVNQLIQGETIKENIKRLPDETFDDVRAYCFELTLDGQGLVDLTKEIEEIWEVSADQKLDEETSTRIIDMFETVKVSVCSGRQDKLIYKLNLSVGIEYEGTRIEIIMESDISDYNSDDITMEKPEEYSELDDVMTDLLTPDPMTYEEFCTYMEEESEEQYQLYEYTDEQLQELYQQYLEAYEEMYGTN